MFHFAFCYRAALALGVSLGAVVGAVVLQAPLFFADNVARLGEPPAVICDVELGPGGRLAVASVVSLETQLDQPGAQELWIADWDAGPLRWQGLKLDLAPWKIAAAPEGSRVFAVSQEGVLLSIDLTVVPPRPTRLGTDAIQFAEALVSSPDGSQVVIVGQQVSAWDANRRSLSWRRTDLQARSGAFRPDGRRLCVGLTSGGVLELDVSSGRTLRQLGDDDIQALEIAFAPDGSSLILSEGSHYRLVDYPSGETRWRIGATPPILPRFVHGGRALLAANVLGNAGLLLLDSQSGQRLGDVRATSPPRGLLLAADETAFAWSCASRTIVVEKLQLPPGANDQSAKHQ